MRAERQLRTTDEIAPVNEAAQNGRSGASPTAPWVSWSRKPVREAEITRGEADARRKQHLRKCVAKTLSFFEFYAR